MKKIKGIMICLLICTFLVMGSMAVWADQTGAVSGQPRVFDQAGLFSETEIIQLEEKIAQCRKSTKMDVVIVSAYADGGIELLQVTEEPGRNIPEINFCIDVDYRTGLFGQDMLRNEVLEPLGESLHILYFHG